MYLSAQSDLDLHFSQSVLESRLGFKTFNLFPFRSTSLLKTLWGKVEIARNEQFVLFPQYFLPVLRTYCHIHPI